MLTNPRDAFRGQSMLPNMVPFGMRSGFLLGSDRFSRFDTIPACDGQTDGKDQSINQFL